MTRFVAIRITHCLSARNFANHLPMGRQNLAKGKEARKKTLFLWQKETSPYIRLPKKERIP